VGTVQRDAIKPIRDPGSAANATGWTLTQHAKARALIRAKTSTQEIVDQAGIAIDLLSIYPRISGRAEQHRSGRIRIRCTKNIPVAAFGLEERSIA
jgi:hypothetical protein